MDKLDKSVITNAFYLLDEILSNSEMGDPSIIAWFYGEKRIIEQTRDELKLMLEDDDGSE